MISSSRAVNPNLAGLVDEPEGGRAELLVGDFHLVPRLLHGGGPVGVGAWSCTAPTSTTWRCTGDLAADTGADNDNTADGDGVDQVTITVTATGTGAVAGDRLQFRFDPPTCSTPGSCLNSAASAANWDASLLDPADFTDTL